MIRDDRLSILRAVLERIIPEDDVAGACAAGVDVFVLRLLETDLRAERPGVEAGLDCVEAEARARRGVGFAELDAQGQDEILQFVENGQTKTTWPTDAAEWFSMIVRLAMEGFYSDPDNGGNRGEVSWKMIGYDPGAARRG